MLVLLLLLTTLALADDAAPVELVAMEVELSDGQVLVGRVLRRPTGDVELTLSDGTTIVLPAEAVSKLTPVQAIPGVEGSRWGLDPNRSRYLYTPTAFGLGQGNGYLAQRALVLTSAAVGITDWLDFEAGAVLPLLFAVDLALVPVVTGSREAPVVPAPWVSFAWNWSLRRE